LRLQLLLNWWDERPTLGGGRPSYSDYTRSGEYRLRISGPATTQFGAKCWVCGREENRRQNVRLTVAHIIYPSAPFSEVIDADNLSRTDVVLICWEPCHGRFDNMTDRKQYHDIDELRFESVEFLRMMKDEVEGYPG
jgi:hypothetical protein